MDIIETHRSPLNRQVHEGVELDTNGADVILNSKSEWNHCRIPRIVIEVGDEVEEDESCGMVRSTELGGKERGRIRMRIKPQEKRGRDEKEMRGDSKKIKVSTGQQEVRKEKEINVDGCGRRSRRGEKKGKIKGGEDMESGERLKGWLAAYGISRETREIKGAEGHIDRMRGEYQKKVEVRSGGFSFTFKKYTNDKIKKQVEEINEREREEKRKREELFSKLKEEEEEKKSGIEKRDRGMAEKSPGGVLEGAPDPEEKPASNKDPERPNLTSIGGGGGGDGCNRAKRTAADRPPVRGGSPTQPTDTPTDKTRKEKEKAGEKEEREIKPLVQIGENMYKRGEVTEIVEEKLKVEKIVKSIIRKRKRGGNAKYRMKIDLPMGGPMGGGQHPHRWDKYDSRL